MSLTTWCHQGPCDPNICDTFTLNPHWGRVATDHKRLVSMHAGSLRSYPTFYDPVACGLPGLSVTGFSRQEYWSALTNTAHHTLLEFCISCCPSRQLPWVPGAARTSMTQAAAPPPHLTLTGADPSPPRQPQEQTPVNDPHAEEKIKPQFKPRSVWLRKMTQNLPTSCISCRLNPHDQVGRLCADPTAGPETSTVLEGLLGRWDGLWPSVRERTPTVVTQEKHVLFLCFDLFCHFFWYFFFFFSFPPLL